MQRYVKTDLQPNAPSVSARIEAACKLEESNETVLSEAIKSN
jgi:hypothetical protein